MKKLVLICLLLFGCASNEQIALCVQTCKSVNAKMDTIHLIEGDLICTCTRYFRINKDSTNVQEVTQ